MSLLPVGYEVDFIFSEQALEDCISLKCFHVLLTGSVRTLSCIHSTNLVGFCLRAGPLHECIRTQFLILRDDHIDKDVHPVLPPSHWTDQNSLSRASLVAQWLRICLLMQGTRVRALVWEDPTCHGATGPVSHNY